MTNPNDDIIPKLFLTWGPPPFQPIVFVPASSRASILPRVVAKAAAIALEPLPNGGNHWCLHLLLASPNGTGSDLTSVLVDVTPSTTPSTVLQDGYKAHIVFSLLEGRDTPELAEKACWMTVRQGLTVQDVMEALVECGAEKYEFDAQARGSRSWTVTQVKEFLRIGLILEETEAEQVSDAVRKGWPGEKDMGPHVARGCYYK